MLNATKTRKPTKPAAGAEARAAYPRLAEWWDATKTHGTIYSRLDVSRSGMSVTVLLWTIRAPHFPSGEKAPVFECCWPWKDGDECAKRLGFSLRRRSFVRGGCGYDRVHAVVSDIAWLMDGTNKSEPYIETLNCPE